MNRIKLKYQPMTETAFYILYALQEPLHGYGVMTKVKEISHNRLHIGSGTMYGTLTRYVEDGLLTYAKTQANDKKRYVMTDLGKEILDNEVNRIKEMYELVIKK